MPAAADLSRLYDEDDPTPRYRRTVDASARGETAVHRPPPELLAKLRTDASSDTKPTTPPPSPTSEVREILRPTTPPLNALTSTLVALYASEEDEEAAKLGLTNTILMPSSPRLPTIDGVSMEHAPTEAISGPPLSAPMNLPPPALLHPFPTPIPASMGSMQPLPEIEAPSQTSAVRWVLFVALTIFFTTAFVFILGAIAQLLGFTSYRFLP